MKTTAIFVYGTLRKGGRNHHLLSSAQFIGDAKTKRRFVMRASSIPFVSDAQQVSFIQGEVYVLNDECLEAIDHLESFHPNAPELSWYEREEIEVILEDTKAVYVAQMYFNRKENDKPIFSSGDFFNEQDRYRATEYCYYFAYGSNRNPSRMRMERGLCFSERFEAILKNHQMVFNKRSSDGKNAFANIEACPGKSVKGILYKLSASSMERLDRFEGAPYHYTRNQMFVEVDGREVLAEVYLAHPDWIQEGLEPSKEYLAHCNHNL